MAIWPVILKFLGLLYNLVETLDMYLLPVCFAGVILPTAGETQLIAKIIVTCKELKKRIFSA